MFVSGEIIRGTTPKHEFLLPFDEEIIKELRVTYGQNKHIILRKTQDEVEFGDKLISIRLTQEETLLFSTRGSVTVEIKTLLNNGEVISNYDEPILLRVVDCLNEEVLQ